MAWGTNLVHRFGTQRDSTVASPAQGCVWMPIEGNSKLRLWAVLVPAVRNRTYAVHESKEVVVKLKVTTCGRVGARS